MTRTEMRSSLEEWEVEVCENCGHEAGQHYERRIIELKSSGTSYVAEGCMVLDSKGRKLEGDNPYLRCKCVKLI